MLNCIFRQLFYFYILFISIQLFADNSGLSFKIPDLINSKFNSCNETNNSKCPPILESLNQDDDSSRALIIKSYAPTCRKNIDAAKSKDEFSSFIDPKVFQDTMQKSNFDNLGEYSDSVVKFCTHDLSSHSQDKIAKFYFYTSRLNAGAAKLIENQFYVADVLGHKRPSCPSLGVLSVAFQKCSQLNKCTETPDLLSLSKSVTNDEELYKKTLEDLKAFPKDCQKDKVCEEKKQIDSGLIYGLQVKNPWFLDSDFSESAKSPYNKLKDYLEKEEKEMKSLMQRISKSAFCLHGAGDCDVDEIRNVTSLMPDLNINYSKDNKKNYMNQHLEAQACMEKAAIDRNSTGKIMNESAANLALTAFTFGGGALINGSKAIRTAYLAKMAKQGGQSIESAGNLVNSFIDSTEVAKACGGFGNKDSALQSTKNKSQCPSFSQNSQTQDQEKGSCLVSAALAAVSNINLLKTGSKLKEAIDASKEKSVKTNFASNDIKSNESINLDSNQNPNSLNMNANKSINNIDKYEPPSLPQTIPKERVQQAMKEVESEKKLAHDKAYIKPGSIDRSKITNIEELKKNYTVVNFVTSNESEKFESLLGEKAKDLHFFENRFNVLKECNDHLVDKDACTSLGHLFQDIFVDKINQLNAKNGSKILFNSNLKVTEVAVAKDNSALLNDVIKARDESLAEWKRLSDPLINELKAKAPVPHGKNPTEWASRLNSTFELNHWFSRGDQNGSLLLADKEAEFTKQSSSSTRTKKPLISTSQSIITERNNAYQAGEKIMDKIANNPTAAKILLVHHDQAGYLFKPDVWDIVKKYKRPVDIPKLREALNKELKNVSKSTYKTSGDNLDLTDAEVAEIQDLYLSLGPLGASPRSTYRSPPEAGIFTHNGGESKDLKGFNAQNYQNTQLAVKLSHQENVNGPVEDQALSYMNRVQELDVPTTRLLNESTARMYLAAQDFAAKNKLGKPHFNTTGDDVLLAFSKELTPTQWKEYHAMEIKYLGASARHRSSGVNAGLNYDQASEVVSQGESIEKSITVLLKESNNFGGFSKNINIFVHRTNSDSMDMEVRMNDQARKVYNNMSKNRKLEFENYLKQLLKKSTQSEQINPGKINYK